ncbi:MAG: HAMP domain-containing histidine kinase [Bacteroidetes bacterium]|nr:HAMP domain-containing histidine kinase [Bacteroidota bacterium]
MNTLFDIQLSNEILDFFRSFFVFTDFPARWTCGKWSGFHGWIYIISDIMVFMAYFSIPALLFFFVKKKKEVPFKGVAALFILFILFCGITHLMDAIIFWYPAYRLNAILLMITAIVSWITVGALIKVIPIAFTLKTTEELETVIKDRTHELTQQKNNLSDIAHILSHNLRAPIANLFSLFEIYDLKESDQERKETLDKLKFVVESLNKKVDRMAEVVDWQTGEVTNQRLLVSDSIKVVLDTFKPLIEETQTKVNLSFNNANSINYPKPYLDSLFNNLIGNSIKYRDPDKINEISITTSKTKDGILIDYSDNGIGIDLEKYRDKVFGLNQTFHENKDAQGIGLYLVKHHVESLGGTIDIESKVGVGTKFKINLKNQKLD